MTLRWAPSALLAVVAPLLPLTSAAHSQTNIFTSNPISNSSSSSPTWSLGQEVTLTWTTDFSPVSVGFLSASDEGTYISFYEGSDNSTTWTVDVNGTAWASYNVVYYMVCEGSEADAFFYSQPVYIVAPGASANTLSTSVTRAPTASLSQVTVLQTVTPTASGAVPAATTTTNANANANAAAATNTQAAPITEDNSDKLGNGTIAGIAVGAVAGVAAAAAAIFFLLRNRRLKRELLNTQANTRSSYMPYDQLPPNSGVVGARAFSPDPSNKSPAGFVSGAAAAAGGGYYGEKGQSMVSQLSELPVARADNQSHRISELPGGPVEFEDGDREPVEIGGTELRGPMEEDEGMQLDARPLMGEHPRDTTD